MKTCSACRDDKSLEQFNKNKALKDGLDNQCKLCARTSKNKWKKANKVAIARQHAKYYAKYRSKSLARVKQWRLNNLSKAAILGKSRSKAIRERTPKWLTELHYAQMDLFYQSARALTKELDIKFQVDHIIPIKGKNVSGLHVPWNLQVLPASLNISKGNRT